MSAKKIDKFIPWFFVIFFILVGLKTIPIVFVAKNSWSGLVNDAPYVKGISYNEVLSKQEEQDKLGWRHKIDFVSNGNNGGKVSFSLYDKNGVEIKNAEVYVEFLRPVENVQNISYFLEQKEDMYVRDIELPLFGNWDVLITANAALDGDKKTYKAQERILLLPD